MLHILHNKKFYCKSCKLLYLCFYVKFSTKLSRTFFTPVERSCIIIRFHLKLEMRKIKSGYYKKSAAILKPVIRPTLIMKYFALSNEKDRAVLCT